MPLSISNYGVAELVVDSLVGFVGEDIVVEIGERGLSSTSLRNIFVNSDRRAKLDEECSLLIIYRLARVLRNLLTTIELLMRMGIDRASKNHRGSWTTLTVHPKHLQRRRI